jgi:hypothetical protein
MNDVAFFIEPLNTNLTWFLMPTEFDWRMKIGTPAYPTSRRHVVKAMMPRDCLGQLNIMGIPEPFDSRASFVLGLNTNHW